MSAAVGDYMRFRIILPLANVILGVFLFHLGDLQVRRIIAAHPSGLEEPLQDGAATARYVDYALNAPAWALVEDPRIYIWSPSTYWTGHDLHYFLAVAAMWFLIGYKLDKRFIAKDIKRIHEMTWWNRTFAWACLLCGLFTCYSVFWQKPHPEPLTDYFRMVFNVMLHGRYGWWYQLGLAWSLGLILVGSYWLLRRNGPTLAENASTT
jgi:hypothetical protein